MMALSQFDPDIVVLDDGFQHLPLMRDLDLVLLDSRRPIGNGYLLPRGPLREPLTALGRGDAFILTRCEDDRDAGGTGFASRFQPLESLISGKPLYRCSHAPHIQKVIRAGRDSDVGRHHPRSSGDTDPVKDRRVWAFSGIARNDEFRATVEHLGCRLVGFEGFPDHYAYRDPDLEGIKRRAEEAGAEFIVTTEKDSVRIPESPAWPVDLVVVGLEIEFEADGAGAVAFDDFLAVQLKSIVGR